MANGHEKPDREQEGLMKARTPYLKLLSASTMALLVITVAGYLMSERASAQRTPPPVDPVLAAVQDVQRSVVGLEVNVNALQNSVDAQLAPMGVNFRWTPAVRASNDSVDCMVVNVSNVEKTIHIEVKVRDGSTEGDATVIVAPGATNFVAIAPRNFDYHCKFTVINGTRADIRGTLNGFGPNGHSFQIPAE
jgi:hypothetical protein